ncbi:Uma2 family endonuclease [Spirosoma sp. BT702]|uniref:Uma2 family endonuclease n=1 Tax=Spirosoma profusum TaxID=2771354 RepID=A0A926XTJ1_9BACT|nr:Uma2 family endonuclease [Spirosoma profusum]MBD2699519.1 Uma2 family endonuclease [Spirosoma profusum]
MEAVAPKIPMTLQERDEAPEIIRIPATWEDYLELAEVVPYNIEYFDGELISMSQATVLHEQLVIQLGALFYFLLENQPDYRVLGSNVKICIEEGKADFNADLSVIKGSPEYAQLPSRRLSTGQIKNPEIVVEVLSKSTKAYDQSDKLDQYRLIPSLKHILFVSQEEVFVRIYSRTDQPAQWLDADYRSIEDNVQIGNLSLSLRSIYRKTPLAQ